MISIFWGVFLELGCALDNTISGSNSWMSGTFDMRFSRCGVGSLSRLICPTVFHTTVSSSVMKLLHSSMIVQVLEFKFKVVASDSCMFNYRCMIYPASNLLSSFDWEVRLSVSWRLWSGVKLSSRTRFDPDSDRGVRGKELASLKLKVLVSFSGDSVSCGPSFTFLAFFTSMGLILKKTSIRLDTWLYSSHTKCVSEGLTYVSSISRGLWGVASEPDICLGSDLPHRRFLWDDAPFSVVDKAFSLTVMAEPVCNESSLVLTVWNDLSVLKVWKNFVQNSRVLRLS